MAKSPLLALLPLLHACGGAVEPLGGERARVALSEQAELVAPGVEPSADFGICLDAEQGGVVAGAPDDSTDAGPYAGSVSWFSESGGSWSFQASIAPGGARSDDYFGSAVSIEGDRMLVGAPGYEHVNPFVDQFGAAYLFERTGSGWQEVTKLTAPDTLAPSWFGTDVRLAGGVAFVGNAPSPSSQEKRSVYVFALDAGTFTLETKLTGPWGGPGLIVASGDTLAGTVLEDPAGAAERYVYVYRRDAGSWPVEQKLADPYPATGASVQYVALDADTLLLGDPGVSTSGSLPGGAWVYARSGTTWSEQAALLPASSTPGDGFGQRVALDGDTAVVASDEDGAHLGHVFRRTGTTWAEADTLDVAVAAPGSELVALAIRGRFVVAAMTATGGRRVFAFDLEPPVGSGGSGGAAASDAGEDASAGSSTGGVAGSSGAGGSSGASEGGASAVGGGAGAGAVQDATADGATDAARYVGPRSGSGCACSATQRRPGWPPTLVLLAALLSRRRRRPDRAEPGRFPGRTPAGVEVALRRIRAGLSRGLDRPPNRDILFES